MIKDSSDHSLQVEFSRFISCEKGMVGGKSYRIEASPDECRALARRLSIDKLDFLKAAFTVSSDPAGSVSLEGSIEATLRQTCVISLKPVVSSIHCSVQRTYSAAAQPQPEPENEPYTDDGQSMENLPEPPELLENGGIDLGEVAAQELAVEIDPFPRIAGAEFDTDPEDNGDQHHEVAKNPFAVLEKLKKKLK